MSNVVQLLLRKKIEVPLVPQAAATTGVVDVLVSSTQLARSMIEYSRHIEALDRCIDEISDVDSRIQLRRVLKLARERLANAILNLSQGIGELALSQVHDIRA